MLKKPATFSIFCRVEVAGGMVIFCPHPGCGGRIKIEGERLKKITGGEKIVIMCDGKHHEFEVTAKLLFLNVALTELL